MTRAIAWRSLLQVVALHLAAVPLLAGTTPSDGHNRYNVLFLAIDDLRPELGCYGVEAARTPNLDRLAAQGVMFTRHYVQVPTCGASRYAMLTGRSPASSGVTASNEALYSGKSALVPRQLPGAQSMPELFRRSGYHTACIGKISHTPDGRVFAYDGKGDGRPELPNAWDELPTPFGAWERGWGSFFAYRGGRHREDGRGNNDLMEFEAEADEDLPDGLLAGAAVDRLRSFRSMDRPFFLAVGFYKPHLPFVATRGDWEAISDADLAPEPARAKPRTGWHGSSEFYKYDAPFPKTRPLSEEAQLRSRRAYLACVRYTDRQVGKVLDALDESGLADRTIVVVWGDHGWHLGEQQIWGKHTTFERALRSVLMIRAPGVSRAGLAPDALVETTDLYPTLVDLCRPRFDETAHPLDGTSLRPVLTGERPAIRDTAISFWKDAASVRTEADRLVAKVEGDRVTPIALFDVSASPDDATNLLGEEPGVAGEIASLLRRRLDEAKAHASP